MWHITCDTDTWYVTCLGGWTFSQNFSSLALIICDLWYYEDLEEKDDSITESMNDEAVYRTAPATPGLLNICFATTSRLCLAQFSFTIVHHCCKAQFLLGNCQWWLPRRIYVRGKSPGTVFTRANIDRKCVLLVLQAPLPWIFS